MASSTSVPCDSLVMKLLASIGNLQIKFISCDLIPSFTSEEQDPNQLKGSHCVF